MLCNQHSSAEFSVSPGHSLMDQPKHMEMKILFQDGRWSPIPAGSQVPV